MKSSFWFFTIFPNENVCMYVKCWHCKLIASMLIRCSRGQDVSYNSNGKIFLWLGHSEFIVIQLPAAVQPHSSGLLCRVGSSYAGHFVGHRRPRNVRYLLGEMDRAANLLSVPVGTLAEGAAASFNCSVLKELLKSLFSEFRWQKQPKIWSC